MKKKSDSNNVVYTKTLGISKQRPCSTLTVLYVSTGRKRMTKMVIVFVYGLLAVDLTFILYNKMSNIMIIILIYINMFGSLSEIKISNANVKSNLFQLKTEYTLKISYYFFIRIHFFYQIAF